MHKCSSRWQMEWRSHGTIILQVLVSVDMGTTSQLRAIKLLQLEVGVQVYMGVAILLHSFSCSILGSRWCLAYHLRTSIQPVQLVHWRTGIPTAPGSCRCGMGECSIDLSTLWPELFHYLQFAIQVKELTNLQILSMTEKKKFTSQHSCLAEAYYPLQSLYVPPTTGYHHKRLERLQNGLYMDMSVSSHFCQTSEAWLLNSIWYFDLRFWTCCSRKWFTNCSQEPLTTFDL